jgi:hypothetical protein
MISLLITLLLAAIVVYVAYLLIGMFVLPEPVKKIVYLIVGLIILFYLLNYLGLYSFNVR